MKNTRVLNSANILLICNISCCISSFLSLLNFSNCSLCVAFDWASSSLWIAFEWASCSLINSSAVSNSVTLWVVSLDNGGVKVYYERFDPPFLWGSSKTHPTYLSTALWIHHSIKCIVFRPQDSTTTLSLQWYALFIQNFFHPSLFSQKNQITYFL